MYLYTHIIHNIHLFHLLDMLANGNINKMVNSVFATVCVREHTVLRGKHVKFGFILAFSSPPSIHYEGKTRRKLRGLYISFITERTCSRMNWWWSSLLYNCIVRVPLFLWSPQHHQPIFCFCLFLFCFYRNQTILFDSLYLWEWEMRMMTGERAKE